MDPEEQDGVRVLGIGVGLFLLILVWSCTVAGLVLVSRTGSAISTALIVLATIITIVLLAIPRAEDNPAKGEDCSFLEISHLTLEIRSNVNRLLFSASQLEFTL